MKSNPVLGIVGFSICFIFLAFMTHDAYSRSIQGHFVALTLATWLVEYLAARRAPSDFSCGFTFCLMWALLGHGIVAFLLLLSSFFIRILRDGETHPWDLVWTGPSILILVIGQANGPDLVSDGFPAWKVGSMICAVVLQVVGSLWVQSRVCRKRADFWRATVIEKTQRRYRLLILPYSLVVLVAPEKAGWAALAFPLYLAIQKSVTHIGYQAKAQGAEFVIAEAKESLRELDRVHDQLNRVSEKQRLLEQLTKVFERFLTPTQAFAELSRISGELVNYRSIILFQLTEERRLEPVQKNSPEQELRAKAALALRVEPLVEKAWLEGCAFRGTASPEKERRLLSKEEHVVAIPLPPFGVLYFGRATPEPFSKAEATKLLYVTRRAENALVRAEKFAQSEEALLEQTMRAEVLEKQVALTSRLLEASQSVISANSVDQIVQALQTTLEDSVAGCSGALFLGPTEQRAQWGMDDLCVEDLSHFTKMVIQTRRPLSFSNLTETHSPPPGFPFESLMLVPLAVSPSKTGLLLLGSPQVNVFSREVHDFVCTLVCLMCSGIKSLRLTTELKEVHEQIVQASKLSAIGELAASVAHELNTPLAAIGLAIESTYLCPEKAEEILLPAEMALDRAQLIVKGLLNHARQKDSARTLVSISDALQDAIEMVKPKTAGRRQEILVEEMEPGLQVLATHMELQQVLSNLIANASDASPEEEAIKLKVDLFDNDVRIQIEDWGAGIPEEVRSKIFDPFFTTKPEGEGTGLGLSICRELVQRHHGRLELMPGKEKGALFRILLPARLSEEHSVLKER